MILQYWTPSLSLKLLETEAMHKYFQLFLVKQVKINESNDKKTFSLWWLVGSHG